MTSILSRLEVGYILAVKQTKPCRVGIWLYPDAPAADLVEAVVSADRAGVDEMWIADEAVAREPLMILAAAAAQTTNVKLAVGITTPVLRHPGAMASSIATRMWSPRPVFSRA